MRFPMVHSPEELTALVREAGFLPFFAHSVRGFSVEECCPPELWFSDTADGPWEWKGPTARSGAVVYGKLFAGKAGFVSVDWLPDLANLRRDGYDFDARYEDGLASRQDKELYETLARSGSLLSKEWKRLCGCQKGGKKGFDSAAVRLQMQTYVCIADFEYQTDRFGRPFGWGVARYTTPEALFGYEAVTAAYSRAPQESEQRILRHLARLLPQADEKQLLRLIR